MASAGGISFTTFRKRMNMVSSQKVEVMLLVLLELIGLKPIHTD
jgi:hypothetical protein